MGGAVGRGEAEGVCGGVGMSNNSESSRRLPFWPYQQTLLRPFAKSAGK